ncbi:Protein of unknown function [Pyronema omphalodes CBS 100304]|uniref:Uncharacterized protein n=1 Tax=Pyronema omphalodes (strain CBS 100304) TaxID=1076935 RepID=U4LA98_PYROM|nr:Protein of unknown function [Pyronema omphalodes CBS 100304]
MFFPMRMGRYQQKGNSEIKDTKRKGDTRHNTRPSSFNAAKLAQLTLKPRDRHVEESPQPKTHEI